MHGHLSAATIGVYAFVVLILYFLGVRSPVVMYPWLIEAVIVLTLVLLARYLSTTYRIDRAAMSALRLFGSRNVALRDVRRIEILSFRDLSPVGFFGGWGWRGRMWSPRVGAFDAIHTDSAGVLVTAGEIPLFVSPRDPAAFARELSRRVRSYAGPLEVDDGAPAAAARA
ncbi:MAG TPA: hypothetical protein VEL82_02140 [Thermoplasmata archaeon]|nr:hypothetical protein [Thermoplasmata archaeon]